MKRLIKLNMRTIVKRNSVAYLLNKGSGDLLRLPSIFGVVINKPEALHDGSIKHSVEIEFPNFEFEEWYQYSFIIFDSKDHEYVFIGSLVDASIESQYDGKVLIKAAFLS